MCERMGVKVLHYKLKQIRDGEQMEEEGGKVYINDFRLYVLMVVICH